MMRVPSVGLIAGCLLLGACGPSQAEIDVRIATSIAETQSAIPTTTPPPTEVVSHDVEFQLKSTLVQPLSMEIWTIQWGVAGSLSSHQYDYGDLQAHGFTGPGFRTHWSSKAEAKSGHELTLLVSGEYDASCIILVDGEEVTSSTMTGGGQATCQYEIP